MTDLKAGQRLKSTVCDTEIMVIAAPDGDVKLTCGGADMGDEGGSGNVDKAHAEGTVIGKRYVDEGGTIEVLCVKAGEGSLAIDGAALKVKDAKKLPKTD